jgi:hypothetical protein
MFNLDCHPGWRSHRRAYPGLLSFVPPGLLIQRASARRFSRSCLLWRFSPRGRHSESAVAARPRGRKMPPTGQALPAHSKSLAEVWRVFCELCALSRLKKWWRFHDSAGSF